MKNIFLSQDELVAIEKVITKAKEKKGLCFEPVQRSNYFCHAVALEEGIQFALFIPPNTCILRGILMKDENPPQQGNKLRIPKEVANDSCDGDTCIPDDKRLKTGF
jgi:hypothetical protein